MYTYKKKSTGNSIGNEIANLTGSRVLHDSTTSELKCFIIISFKTLITCNKSILNKWKCREQNIQKLCKKNETKLCS